MKQLKAIVRKVLHKRLMLLAAGAMLLLSACSAPAIATSNAVQIPDALKTLIGALIMSAVTVGFQVVFEWIGLDLRSLGAALAAILAGFAVSQLQGWIDLVPAQFDYLVTIVLQIIVVILSGLGVLRVTLNKSRAQQLFQKGFVARLQ